MKTRQITLSSLLLSLVLLLALQPAAVPPTAAEQGTVLMYDENRVGISPFAKTNLNAVPVMDGQWASAFGGSNDDKAYSVQETSDKGFIVAGETNSFGAGLSDAWVLKLNSDGSVAWQKTLGGSGRDWVESIQETKDGGYIFAGYTESFTSGDGNAWIVKLNNNGTVDWQKSLGEGGDEAANYIHQTTDGGYILAGYTNSTGGAFDFWVVKLTSDGTVVWQKTYDNEKAYRDVAEFIQETSDGNFVVVGYTGSYSADSDDAWVIKISSVGNIIWQKRFGGNLRDWFQSVQETENGNIIITGHTYSYGMGESDGWIVKLNSEGTAIWQKTIGGSNKDYFFESTQESSDGSAVFAGYSMSFGDVGYYNVWIVKIASNGSVIWQKTISVKGIAHSIQSTIDDMLVVAGQSWDSGAGRADLWVAKLDNMATIPGCTRVSESNAVISDISVPETATVASVKNSSVTSTTTTVAPQDTDASIEVFCQSATTFTITGQVKDINNDPIMEIIINTESGNSATTDATGSYAITGLITGTYTLTPVKDGYAFTPASSTISVPPDAPSQDFIGVAGGSPPTPFLDLPFDYGRTSQSFITALQNWNEKGRVNSWFDHKYPNYGSNNSTGIWLYNGKYTNNSYWSGSVLCFASYCYDGHDGIDFSYKSPQSGSQALPILASASGTVAAQNNTCPNFPKSSCGGGYGNYVILYHPGNGYFTRYGHLANISTALTTTVSAGDTLGIMGNSGRSGGTHLHFGVYKDNGNGIWDGESIDRPVDPYGWELLEPDPWVAAGGPVSSWLWLYDSDKQVSFSGDQGGSFTDTTDNIQITVPANAFSGQVTLELSPSPVAGASAQLRNGGSSFWLRLLQWLPGAGNTQGVASIQNSSQLTSTLPITFTVAYTDTNILHLNESQLALYYWDESSETWQSLPTTVDVASNLVTAQTEQLGGFSLQAPLICPADDSEPDDSFYRAASISTNDALTNRLFDVAGDQDWFSFNAVAGESYLLETSNLATGVDTIIEVYDQDGLTLLATDDNSGNGAGSRLEWMAPQDGTYFVRVVPATGSSFGCGADYAFTIQGGYRIFLPAIIRNP